MPADPFLFIFFFRAYFPLGCLSVLFDDFFNSLVAVLQADYQKLYQPKPHLLKGRPLWPEHRSIGNSYIPPNFACQCRNQALMEYPPPESGDSGRLCFLLKPYTHC